jgi:hypothetical protein
MSPAIKAEICLWVAAQYRTNTIGLTKTMTEMKQAMEEMQGELNDWREDARTSLQKELIRVNLRSIQRYEGERSALAVTHWEEQVRDALEQIPGAKREQRRNVVKSSLGADPANWLRLEEPKDSQWSAEKLIEMIRTEYYPYADEEAAMRELEDVKQGSDSVSHYVSKFRATLQRTPQLDSKTKLKLFLGGLNNEIATDLQMIAIGNKTYNNLTITQAVELAVNLSQISTGKTPNRFTTEAVGASMDIDAVKAPIHNSQETGLIAKLTEEQFKRYQQGDCIRCGQSGHFARECKSQPKEPGMVSVKTERYQKNQRQLRKLKKKLNAMKSNKDKDSSESEWYEGTNKGLELKSKALVILNKTFVSKNVKTFSPLFQITGTLGGRPTRFMLDSGAQANVVGRNLLKEQSVQWSKLDPLYQSNMPTMRLNISATVSLE